LKTIELVKTKEGYTWLGNIGDNFTAHRNCIIAVHAEHPIGDPQGWLGAHQLLTIERDRALRHFDLGKGTDDDLRVIKDLAKLFNIEVKT
jgi:hypothetical protein